MTSEKGRDGERPPTSYLYNQMGEENPILQDLVREEDKSGKTTRALVSQILRDIKHKFSLSTYYLFLLRHYYFIRERDKKRIQACFSCSRESLMDFLNKAEEHSKRKEGRRRRFLKTYENKMLGKRPMKIGEEKQEYLMRAFRVSWTAPQVLVSELTGLPRGTIGRRLHGIEKFLHLGLKYGMTRAPSFVAHEGDNGLS